MKRFILWLAVTFAALLAAKEPLSATLAYQMVSADQATVTITVTGQGRPQIALPKVTGGRWLENQKSEGTSVQSSFVNGQGSVTYTFTCTLPFLLTRDEEVTIPPVVVMLNGERTQTDPVTFPPRAERLKQTRDGENGVVDLAALSATLTFPRGARYFAGETVAFSLSVAVPQPCLLARLGMPEFPGAEHLVFAAPRRLPRSKPKQDERGNLTIYHFDGAFQSSKSVSFSTAANIAISLVVPTARRNRFFNDPFFGEVQGTQLVREIRCQSEVKELQIVPLPPPPEGTFDLALAGTWQIKAKFSPGKKIRAGEVMTLVISGTGDQSSAGLRAPELSHEKFRIYPPNVKKSGAAFQLEYAMIPLAAGAYDLDFPLAVFDLKSGNYQLFHAQTHLEVTPGAATAPKNIFSQPETPAETSENAARRNFFYPRSAGRHFVIVPLWQNVAATASILLIASALIGVTILAWSKRRHFTPVWHHRAQKRHLRQLLKRADAGTLAAQLPGAVGNLLQLPPGATTAEIAAKIDDPVVRDALEKCGASDFMPGNPGWDPDRKTRALLWRHLKKLFLFFGILLPWMMAADHPLFDAGRFADAAKSYEAKYDPKRADVDLLYNIGAAHFHAQNFAAARLALRRAQLLAPRDREIAEQLVAVESKLPPVALEKSRTCRVIDHLVGVLRPDEWLLAGSAILAVFLFALGFFPLLAPVWRWSAAIAIAALLLLCAFALQQESRRLYFPGEAMVTAETTLRTLPSAASGRVEATLPAGSDLRILETHGTWLLAETPKGRGWVAASDVEKLFHSGLW